MLSMFKIWRIVDTWVAENSKTKYRFRVYPLCKQTKTHRALAASSFSNKFLVFYIRPQIMAARKLQSNCSSYIVRHMAQAAYSRD